MPVVLALFSFVWCLILLFFKNFRNAFVLSASTLLSIGFLLAFRLYYFDALYPNPVGIKAAGATSNAITSEVGEGLLYLGLLLGNPYTKYLLWLGIATYLFSALLATFVSIREKQTRPNMLAFNLFIAIYFFFVIFSGGDWMREGRFWVPLIAPFCLVLAFAVQALKKPLLQISVVCLFLYLQAGYARIFFPNLNFGVPVWYEKKLAEQLPGYTVFERHNREHLRDIHIIDSLQSLLPAMLAARQDDKPITIMSKQMGMVSYHLASRYFGHIKIIDLGGLVENSVRDCPEAAIYGYGRQGLGMDIAKYFERLPYSTVSCDLPAPDIIFDVYGWGNRDLPERLKKQGYISVFNQYGQFSIPYGGDMSANQLIAVHPRWLGKLQLSPQKLDFNLYQKSLFE